MGSLSDYAENELLDHIIGVGAYTPVATVYVGLSTADPLDTAAGLAEPVGNNYQRKAAAYGAASARAITNSGTISFDQASGSWGTITHWAIFDAQTNGNMLAHGSLTTPRAIVSGNTPSFAASELDISFNSGGISTYLANTLLDFMFRNQGFTQPTIYAGLSTVTITDAMAGNNVTEPSGNNYARKAHASWKTSANGASDNNGTLTFNTPTGNWGNITYNFLADNATTGNILFYAAQSPTQSPQSGDTVRFADGAWDVSIS